MKLNMENIKRLLNGKSKTKYNDNPYLTAKRAWNDNVEGLMNSLHLWQVVGLSSMLISLIAVSGIFYIGSQSKFVPLVFTQDTAGNVLQVSRADTVPKAVESDYKVTAANFVRYMREVSSDPIKQRQFIYGAYGLMQPNTPAIKKSDAYFKAEGNNPIVRGQKETVEVEVLSVLHQSSDAWQVEWRETTYSKDGSIKDEPVRMRGIVNLTQREPTADSDETEIIRNPHFIFANDYSFGKQL